MSAVKNTIGNQKYGDLKKEHINDFGIGLERLTIESQPSYHTSIKKATLVLSEIENKPRPATG
jgi:hypothetical protein